MMPRLTVSVAACAPDEFTLSYARTFFEERASGTRVAQIELHVPLPPIAHGITIDKAVTLRAHWVPDRSGTHALGISWSTPDSNAFPGYDGVLTACGSSDGQCVLTLAGGYRPPGGIAGAVFDSLAGRRIARATIDALLAQIRDGAQADYATRLLM